MRPEDRAGIAGKVFDLNLREVLNMKQVRPGQICAGQKSAIEIGMIKYPIA